MKKLKFMLPGFSPELQLACQPPFTSVQPYREDPDDIYLFPKHHHKVCKIFHMKN